MKKALPLIQDQKDTKKERLASKTNIFKKENAARAANAKYIKPNESQKPLK